MSKRSHALKANTAISVASAEYPTEFYDATIMHSSDQDRFCISQPRKGSMILVMRAGQRLMVRCAFGDNQFAFETTVCSVQTKPSVRINLDTPQHLAAVMRRQGQRTPVANASQPAMRLKLHDGRKVLDVRLKDLDQFGACLSATEALGKVNDKFTIETYDRRLDRPVSLHCVIRYLRHPGNIPADIEVAHGVSFEDVGSAAELFIEHLTAPHQQALSY